MLITSYSKTDLEMITRESMSLFKSRGFKLRKWVANGLSKSILSNILQNELGPSIREIDLGSHAMPDFEGLVTDNFTSTNNHCAGYNKLFF